MKKKLFAILLAAVMVTALLPTMAFAEPAGDEGGNSSELTKLWATISVPEVGKDFDIDPQFDEDPESSIVSAYVNWYKVSASEYNIGGTNTWEEVDEGEVAQTGYFYMPEIVAALNRGVSVADEASIKLNDTELVFDETADTAYNIDDGYLFLSYVCEPIYETKELTKYWVIINTPQVGKTLDFAPQADFAPQGSITSPDVTWYKILKENYDSAEDDDWTEVAEDEVVKEGYLYAALLQGTLGETYVVADNASVKLNDKVLTYSEEGGKDTYTVSEREGILYMSEIFEPMAADETTTTTDGTNPKTGDNGSMFLWVALMAAGAAAAGVAVANRRKFSGR